MTQIAIAVSADSIDDFFEGAGVGGLALLIEEGLDAQGWIFRELQRLTKSVLTLVETKADVLVSVKAFGALTPFLLADLVADIWCDASGLELLLHPDLYVASDAGALTPLGRMPYEQDGLRLLGTIAGWIDALTENEQLPGHARLVSAAEELMLHLQRALDDRENLLKRLEAALRRSQDAERALQHANATIRALERTADLLQAQLQELLASRASGDPTLWGRSKHWLAGTATGVLVALSPVLPSAYLADYLNDDDTAAIVQALESVDRDELQGLVDAAMRCIKSE